MTASMDSSLNELKEVVVDLESSSRDSDSRSWLTMYLFNRRRSLLERRTSRSDPKASVAAGLHQRDEREGWEEEESCSRSNGTKGEGGSRDEMKGQLFAHFPRRRRELERVDSLVDLG